MSWRATICLVALCVLCGAASAQTKVGYVDLDVLLQNAPQIQEVRDRLDIEFRPRTEAIEANEQRLWDLEERLIEDISSDARQSLEREIRSLRRAVQRDREDLREELDYRANEERHQVEQEIVQIAQQFAQDNGFDLIVSGPAIYASADSNLTERLLEHLAQAHTEANQQRFEQASNDDSVETADPSGN